MNRPGFASVMLALIVLAGCASAGSIYKPATGEMTVGYSEQEIGLDTYRVTFVAPKSAGSQQAQDLALLRAADLILTKGHTWLRLTSRTTAEVLVPRESRVVSNTAQQNMNCGLTPGGMGGSINQLGCSYTPSNDSIGGANVTVITGSDARIVVVVDFVMGDGAMPAGAEVYDAKATAERIRAGLEPQ